MKPVTSLGRPYPPLSLDTHIHMHHNCDSHDSATFLHYMAIRYACGLRRGSFSGQVNYKWSSGGGWAV